ncbi:helix-turn-helix domain-containing protein [Streptomyces sp. NBC_01136]|uniref:PucR family transcriptional regulator n=1 Tax=unclassified Streptomyces TaxID=2593676 RepID=UPI003251B7CE|nr:helix-turn-helix domain-containing protein [Streptomyces sp. NBC_01136]
MATSSLIVTRNLSVVASNVAMHSSEVSRDVWELLIAEIPQLRGDEIILNILKASVEENIATMLHVFENDTPLENVEGPASALDYARRLAQRNVPISALIRAYRIGHCRFLRWCLDELRRQGTTEDISTATAQRMLEVSFGYIDRVSERVIEIYQLERDRWLLSRTAVRAGRVREILTEKQVDPDLAESALGYRLRQHHVGMVLWLPERPLGGEGLARLDRLAGAIAEELDCGARPLFAARDETLSWAWLPFGSHREVSWDALSSAVEDGDPTARVAAGDVEGGVEGFRRTHRQALRAQELAMAASPGARVTAYAQVAPIALMCTNIDDIRAWVWSVLGALAVDDEHCARLRETLQTFLSTGCSYTATASRQILHKNTVQYRIRKAEESLGRPLHERRPDLEVALLAVQYLGSPLLRTPL